MQAPERVDPRSVFRTDALRRHAQDRDKSVLPRFVSPRTFLALWLLGGIFVSAGFSAWFARVPVYVSGPALVISSDALALDPETDSPLVGNRVALVAFLPAPYLSLLRAGQMMYLDLHGPGTRVPRPILTVETAISSPSESRTRFGMDAEAAGAVSQPSAVVIAALEPTPSGLPASLYTGSTYQGYVEVGSRRIASFVPLVSTLFEDTVDR